MRRFIRVQSSDIRKASVAAVALAIIGLSASYAMADGYENYGHWLCDNRTGTCIWIWD